MIGVQPQIIDRLTSAKSVGELPLSSALTSPGVYRMSPPHHVYSAIMVTMQDGRNLYINDDGICIFPANQYPGDKIIWATKEPVPLSLEL